MTAITSPPATESRKNPKDEVFLSGSSVGKVLQNRALENWMLEATAEWTVSNVGLISKLVQEDRAGEAVARVKDSRWEGTTEPGPLSAAERGTAIHEAIEAWLVGEERPQLSPEAEAQIGAHLTQVSQWFVEMRPVPVAIEMVVYSDQVRAAGRGDMWVRFLNPPPGLTSGDICLVDTKTKREERTKRGYTVKPYSDVALQLAPYRWANLAWTHQEYGPRIARRGDRSYFLNAEERDLLVLMSGIVGHPMDIKTFVLQVTPESCRLFPIDTDLDVLTWVGDVVGASRGKDLSLVGSPVWESE